MSAGSRERAAASAAVLLALAAGCTTRDIAVRPFRISAVAIAGPPLQPATDSPFVVVSGTAHRLDPVTLRIDDINAGMVRISFDPAAAPDLAFPLQLDGAEAVATLLATDQIHAPDGTPLPFPALAISTSSGGASTVQFLLGEADVAGPDGLAGIPRPLDEQPADAPLFEVLSDMTQFEPTKCGLEYYDLLRVYDANGNTTILQTGQRATVSIAPVPWTVLHVVSWHRVGCSSRTPAWTQLAASRPPPG